MSELDDFIEAQQALDGIIKNISERFTNKFEELGLFGKEFIADDTSFGALEDIDFDDRHLLFPEEFLKPGPGSDVPDIWQDDYKAVFNIDVRELSEVLREDLRLVVRLELEDVFVGDTDKLEKTIVKGFRIEIVDTQSAEGTITGFGYTRTTDAPMLVIEMNPILGPEDNLLIQEGNFLVNSYIEEFYPENRSTRLAVLKGEIPLINTQEGSYENKIEMLKFHTTENPEIGPKQKSDMLKMLEISKNEELGLASEIPTETNIDRATNLTDIPDTPEGAADAVNVTDETEKIFAETLERLRNANDEFVNQQLDDVMAQKINEILPFVNTDLSKAEAVGIRVPPGGPEITTSKDPVLNAFADELGKYAMGEELTLSAKRKLWGLMWSAATDDKYGLIDDKKSFLPELRDGVDASKLDNTGYKVWKNLQHFGSFRPQSLIGMTANEFDAFGPPPYVRLLEGLDKEHFEKTGEYLFQPTAVSDADVNIPEGMDTPTNVVDEAAIREKEIAGITNDYVQNNWNEPKTTGDAIVMRVNDDGVPEILMIERTNPPHTDKWALPGGIVDQQAKDFMDSAGQKDIDQLSELGEKNKQLFFKAHERSDRKYIKYVILNELMEEVGLDVVEKNLDMKFLGVKNNRFDWDARATKGVSVGGGFIFIEDNTWEPKAGSDAKNAKWIKLKDIVDKKIEVAFGHVEWIVNALQDRNIGLNYFGNSFDDNPKYLYGVDKPNETLGDYDDVINKLKEIADKNKSENVKLMEEANIVREQKGMDLIPIDRSNIQGTTERLYRDIRLNGGDWESLKEVLSQENTNKVLYEYIEKYAEPVFTIDDIDITDEFINKINASIEYNSGFEGVINPEKLTKESILNLILYNDPSLIAGARTDATLNESGIRKIAQSIQENLLKGIEAQVEFIKQNYNITDPVFLDAWAENYKKKILQNDFVDNVAALINPEKTPMDIITFYNKNTGQISFTRDFDASARQGLANFLNTRNPFFLDEIMGDSASLIYDGGQKTLVDQLFEGYENETTRDFFMENTENFGDKLNQKAAYLDENGILHFQTNHGAAGPSESALNLIEYINDKYKNNPDVIDITTLLKDQAVNFLDKDLKYVTPYHNGPDGLLGKVFYTTTNPFVGMGYGTRNSNATTPGTMNQDIKWAITSWLKDTYQKGNDEAVNEVIEVAKKFGIVINIDRPDLKSFTDREDIIRDQTQFKIKPLDGSDLNFGAATVSNIQGEVHVDNILFANQSVKAGNRRAKLRRFYTAALEQFDNWWINELDTPRFIFNIENHVLGINNTVGRRYDVLNNRFITYENKTANYTLSDDYKQIIAYDQLKPIEGAVDVSTVAKYYEWLELNDPQYKPMVSSLVGFGEYNRIHKALSGSEQLKQNEIVLANKIFELIGVDVQEGGIGPQPSLKKGQAGQVADYLDSIHHQFSINQSIQIQELANYFRVSEALKEGDFDTAKKLLPKLVIPETPTLFEEMVDVDTDEALYRSQFADNTEKIIDDIDKELIYYLDRRNNKNKPFNFTNKLEAIEDRATGKQDDTAYGITYKENQKWIEADRDYNRNNETIELNTSEQIDKKRQRIYNFAEANNIKINLNTDNDVIEFLDTASRFSLFAKNNENVIDTLKTDRIIFALAGNQGYEVILGTGGGNVGGVPHYMIGLIDPNNTLQTNEVKTLKARVVNIAHLNELEAKEFIDIQGKNLSELTDSEFRLLSKYMDPSVLETQISEEVKENFVKTISDNQVLFSDNIGLGSIVDGPNQTVDVTLLMLDEEITRVANAVQTGQAPKELLENLLNQYAVTLANAPEDIKAKILTAGNKSLDLLNHYGIKGVKGIGQAARFGFKLADRYDWAVLGPAFIDILSSRISGSGTQFQTIGGALGDTMYRYEDVETNSVMEMLYGNKNVQEATGLFGLNIAYPVVNAINAGKDAFKTHIYDNNFLGIESLFTFLKPKAIEALKTVTDQAGLNDWVYNVKRDLIVDTLMKDNNVPYTKENVDFYTKYYEENNPRTTDRYGNELPANYEQNWISSRPSNLQSTGFSTDERIRTGQRYIGAGGGSGQKKE